MLNLTFVVAGNTPGAPSPDLYRSAAQRFIDTYIAFPAMADHRLLVVNSNGGYDNSMRAIFSAVPHDVVEYRGTGWDIGAHQYSAMTLPADDWIMCFSSWAHFRRPGWLKAFIDAREHHGDALYGSMLSHERNLHLRGTGFFVRAGRIHRYPHGCNSREESFEFESGADGFTQWCLQQGYGAYLVTPMATLPAEDPRAWTLANTFRRGDQSNLWTYDKHTVIYDNASADERAELTLRSAYTLAPKRRFRSRVRVALRHLASAMAALME